MQRYELVVDDEGSVTLPVEMMALWDLRPGQDVELYDSGDGSWHVRPLNATSTAFFENRTPRPASIFRG